MDASISYADSPVLYSIIRAQAEQMPMHVREVPNFGSSYYDNYLYLCFLVVFHFSWCVIVKDKKMQITLLHADSSRILLPVPVVVDAAASICLQRNTEGRNPLLMSADLQPHREASRVMEETLCCHIMTRRRLFLLLSHFL